MIRDLWFDLRRAKHSLYRQAKRLRGRLLRKLGRLPETGWGDVPVAFILSTGRTGTTFLSRFLNDEPTVLAHHEPQPDFFDLGLNYLRGQTSSREVKRDLRANRHKRFRAFDPDRHQLYVEANYFLYPLVEILGVLIEDVRFVHLVRDGRDVVRSAYERQWYRPGDRYNRLTPGDLESDPFADEWEDMDRFERLAWNWQRKDRILTEQFANQPRSKKIYFEELFDAEKDYPGLQQLTSFVDLPDRDRTGRMGDRVRSSRPYSIPHWTEWTAERRDQFDRIAGDHLRYHGYEW